MEAKRNLAALVDPISKQPFNLTNNLPYALTCGHTLSLSTFNILRLEGKNKCPVCQEAIVDNYEPKVDIQVLNMLSTPTFGYLCPKHPRIQASNVSLKGYFIES